MTILIVSNTSSTLFSKIAVGTKLTKKGEYIPSDALEFSNIEEEDLPSFSPRPPVDLDPDEAKPKSDKREQRDRKAYIEKHPEILKLIEYLELKILESKPSDVLAYACKLFEDQEALKITIGCER